MSDTPIERAPVERAPVAGVAGEKVTPVAEDSFQQALASLVQDTTFRAAVVKDPAALTAKFSRLKAGEIAVLSQITATASKFADGDINCCCCCCA